MPRRHFSTRLRRRKQLRSKTLNNIVVFLIVLMPIYPAFWSYMQDYTGAIVRWQYDRSSIIAAYDGTTGIESFDILQIVDNTIELGEPIAVEDTSQKVITSPGNQTDTTISQKPILADKKTPLYISHVVVSGDTLGSIAQKYGISVSTLQKMNGLEGNFLSINQKLVIPQIRGVQYVVKKGDTLSLIASTYGIKDAGNILLANDLEKGAILTVWKKLLLPSPTKDPTKILVKKPLEKKTSSVVAVSTSKKIIPKKDAVNIQKTLSYGGYSLDLKVEKWCRNFVWWNCTCFVAKYKNVTWRGNAKEWIKNARKQWVPTGDTPKPWAIIVYHGPGFPPAYGHVGIVMEVTDDGMIIKDMNYRALNEVTTRREVFNNPAIIGYIYVD